MAQFGTSLGALGLILALLAGLSALAKRVLPRWGIGPVAAGGSAHRAVSAARAPSVRLDPRRKLTLVALGGRQFAVLTGGASDVLIALPVQPDDGVGDAS
ncbi:MAG TPA: hypothetical protein PK677_00355 [Acidiphilium sp.]|nr:hypothetical protein [Acidiphilium sp.]HQU22969.1 hypothetical protein [Acidiphilium sp.]